MSPQKRVLHVDDDEHILRTVGRLLQNAGFAVISTTSPFIAPIIQKEKPDVIVMDVDMPLLSGDRIVTIIRGNEFSNLPVVFFSGKSAQDLATISAKTQPSAYVRKEQGIPMLIEKINALTAGR